MLMKLEVIQQNEAVENRIPLIVYGEGEGERLSSLNRPARP